jgi:opacity protein-like surface antigen
VFFEGGYQGFIATETFDATLGKTGGGVLGGGGSLTHRSGIFVQVDVTRFKAEGERAFVYGSQVFRLGIPLNLEVRPIEVSGGYKFFMRPPKPKAPVPPPKPLFEPARPTRGEQAGATGTTPVSEAPASRRPSPTPRPRWGGLKPYVGGGMGVVRYRETSSFASSGENVDDSFTSVHLLGGIEVPLWKWVGTAVEVNYRWVQDALGEGGLSSEFGEDDLGGPSFRVKISVGR